MSLSPYYQDDAVTIYHGEALAVLASLPDASVDHVVTDPPYSSGGMFGSGGVGSVSFVVELVGGPSDGHQMRCDALHDSFLYGNTPDRYRKRTAPVMRLFQPSLLHPPVSAPVWLYDYQPPEGATT